MRPSAFRVLPFTLLALGVATLASACSSSPAGTDVGATPPAASSVAPPSPIDALPSALALGLDLTDAYGPADVVLPAEARLVDGSALLGSNPVHWIGPKQEKHDADAAAAAKQKDQETIASFLAAHPNASNLASLLSAQPDPNDPRVAPLANGDYRVTLPNAKTVVTLGPSARQGIVATAIHEYTKRSNREGIYGDLYAHLPATMQGTYPPPAKLAALSDAELLAKTDALLAWYTSGGLRLPPPDGPPPGYSADCSGDEGSDGKTGDADGATYGAHDPTGLFANVTWPNKWNVTCAKNQANRGTCAIFAVVSALEMSYARDTGRRVNLSEQHLKATYSLNWRPSDFSDGADPFTIAWGMFTSGYHVPFESAWDYNPSWNRQTFTQSRKYTHSCDEYLETCSDTSHQAGLRCTRFREGTFCQYAPQNGALSDVGAPPNFSLLTISDFDDAERQLKQAIALLGLGQRAIVAYLNMGDALMSLGNPSNGIVPDYVGGNAGGHGMHVVGYVPNAQLPSTIPAADGGGYFVAKNSWGPGAGDQGYAYIPFTLMKLYTFAILAM